MDKKTKAKKGKKTVKQQQQKFGFNVNLDEEEPDIPAEKVPSKQEQQFKVVYSKQFKQQRPEDKPSEIELQTKADYVQVPTTKQTQQEQAQAVNTCDNKEQQIESLIQNQNYQAFVSQSDRIKQQIIEAPLSYQYIIQKREREEKKQQKIVEAQVIQIRKLDVLDQKETVIAQKEADKQYPKAQTIKMKNQQILDQENDQLNIIETKIVKKQATKTASKKKDTKSKPKKSTKPILGIDFEEFQQKLELVEEKSSPKLQETQQVPSKTQVKAQIILKQQDSPPAKYQALVQQIQEAQPSLAKQKVQIKQYIQEQINRTPYIQAKHQEAQQVVQQVLQKPISVQTQLIPTINKTSSIIQTQIRLDDEELQPKIEITAKTNKKARKSKATKKQNKNQIKINLDTETFLIEDIKQQIKSQQIQQIERSTNTENTEIQDKKQHNMEKQQQISCPEKNQEKAVYSEDKPKQVQKVQEKDVYNTQIITQVADQTLNNQQRQPVISDNFKQVQIEKEVNNQQIIPQKIIPVEPVEIQLDVAFKVSKVKNVKKGAKKDTKNKSTKVQKQLTMQLQLDDFQIEHVKAKENPIILETIESKKEQEVPIIQTKTNVHEQTILADNLQQNIKDKFIEQIKAVEQKKPNEYAQQEQSKSPKQEHYQTENIYDQPPQQLNRQQPKNNQEQTQKIRQNLPQIQEQYINSPQPAAQIKKQIIEETLILDQPIIKQKGKVQIKKQVKKPKPKPKAKTNQLNLFQSVLEQQIPIELTNVNVPIRQQVYHSPQKEERDIQVQTKTEEQSIPIKQSDKIENKPIQKQRQIEQTEQELQREKQLAFYKKLQEQNQLQLRLMEQNAFTQQSIEPLQNFLRKQNEIVNKIEEQKTEPPKIQNTIVQAKQPQKMKQVEKQPFINLQEQQFSTKIVLSQVNKQKTKTSKKATKKATKQKQKVTSLISADMMEIALQEQPIKVVVQQNVNKITNERQPSIKQAIQVAESRKSDQQAVSKQHSPTIQSPKIVQYQVDLNDYSHYTRQEKKDSPLKQKSIQSPIKKTNSPNNKSESIVAELIDLIRFKGDQDIRLARERLNMLEQDVRSRLLRKGPKPPKLQTRSSQGAEIYGNIIDENISLREQLRNMGRG